MTVTAGVTPIVRTLCVASRALCSSPSPPAAPAGLPRQKATGVVCPRADVAPFVHRPGQDVWADVVGSLPPPGTTWLSTAIQPPQGGMGLGFRRAGAPLCGPGQSRTQLPLRIVRTVGDYVARAVPHQWPLQAPPRSARQCRPRGEDAKGASQCVGLPQARGRASPAMASVAGAAQCGVQAPLVWPSGARGKAARGPVGRLQVPSSAASPSEQHRSVTAALAETRAHPTGMAQLSGGMVREVAGA